MRTGLIVAALLSIGCARSAPPPRAQKVALKSDTMMQPLLDEPATRGLVSGHVTLRPGESMHRHDTENYEELLVVLAGRARVVVGTDPVLVDVGEVLYLPPHTEHEVHNDGKVDVRYLFIAAPAR
jgi:mannose-6-phosphate isomerase-like protein (cupin superfamily)